MRQLFPPFSPQKRCCDNIINLFLRFNDPIVLRLIAIVELPLQIQVECLHSGYQHLQINVGILCVQKELLRICHFEVSSRIKRQKDGRLKSFPVRKMIDMSRKQCFNVPHDIGYFAIRLHLGLHVGHREYMVKGRVD